MNEDTLLLRQIHPSWIKQGVTTSQAWSPYPKDLGQLSVNDGDMIAAEAAWRRFTVDMGYASIGTLAVTVAECCSLTLPVAPAPTATEPDHAEIDFTAYSKKDIETRAKLLRAFANSREWLYRAAPLA